MLFLPPNNSPISLSLSLSLSRSLALSLSSILPIVFRLYFLLYHTFLNSCEENLSGKEKKMMPSIMKIRETQSKTAYINYPSFSNVWCPENKTQDNSNSSKDHFWSVVHFNPLNKDFGLLGLVVFRSEVLPLNLLANL